MTTAFFYPGLNGPVQLEYERSGFRYPKQHEDYYGKSKSDICLLKLKERVPSSLTNDKQLTLGINFSRKDGSLTIFGYPKANLEITKLGQQFRIIGGGQKGTTKSHKLKEIKRSRISYKISATLGHCGSPLITGVNQDIVVGVHKASTEHPESWEEANVGIKLTLETILMLEIWREELGADKFKLIDL